MTGYWEPNTNLEDDEMFGQEELLEEEEEEGDDDTQQGIKIAKENAKKNIVLA